MNKKKNYNKSKNYNKDYDDDFTGYKHYLDDYISRNSVRKGYRLL